MPSAPTPLRPVSPDTDAEFAAIIDELTRRGFLAGGAGAAALLGLAACSSDSHPASGSSATAGPWTYTDDLGHTVHLPRRPTRIACLWDSLTASLWGIGVHNIVASQLAQVQAHVLSGAHVPTAHMTKIKSGNDTEVILEALARAKPDLILDQVDSGALATVSTNPQVAKIAPVAGIDESSGDVRSIIARLERFAASLGIKDADLAGRDQFQAATSRLKQATAKNPGLRVAFCWGASDDLCVYPPANFTAWIPTLAAAGVTFMPAAPTSGADSGGYHVVSWENALSLPVDLLLEKGGPWPATAPAWKAIPAVKAGQAYDTDSWGAAGWDDYSYANYATLLDQVTAVIAKSKPGIGPR